MKLPQPLHVDFVDATPVAARRRGLMLVAAGVAALATVAVAFDSVLAERAHLQAQLELLPAPKREVKAADPKQVADASAVVHELAVPWTPLLTELERASHDLSDKVSLLQVAPDPAKHQVRITAETRTLSDALAYLERLQASSLLRYPMLESHERRKDDPQQPIRVKLVAEWHT